VTVPTESKTCDLVHRTKLLQLAPPPLFIIHIDKSRVFAPSALRHCSLIGSNDR